MADTQKVSFKNTAKGPRGVNDVSGEVVMIDPGKSETVEVRAGELKSAEDTGYFEFGGGAEEPGPLDQSVEALSEHIAGIDDPAEIDKLIEAETGGKSRKGALAALEARKAELEA